MNPIDEITTSIHDDETLETAFYRLETKPMLDPDIWSTRAPAGIPIILNGNRIWTLQVIAAVLNELDDTWNHIASVRLLNKQSNSEDQLRYLRYIFGCEDTLVERWLEVKVCLGTWSVDVQASREWIITEWESISITVNSNEAAQHRKLKSARQREMTKYTWEVKLLKLTTRWIIEKITF
jgi:hypothetical protein